MNLCISGSVFPFSTWALSVSLSSCSDFSLIALQPFFRDLFHYMRQHWHSLVLAIAGLPLPIDGVLFLLRKLLRDYNNVNLYCKPHKPLLPSTYFLHPHLYPRTIIMRIWKFPLKSHYVKVGTLGNAKNSLFLSPFIMGWRKCRNERP